MTILITPSKKQLNTLFRNIHAIPFIAGDTTTPSHRDQIEVSLGELIHQPIFVAARVFSPAIDLPASVRKKQKLRIPIHHQTGVASDWKKVTVPLEAIPPSTHFGIGIGLSITPLICLDLDDCYTRIGDTFYLTDEAIEIISAFPNAYIEISLSNHGIHIIGQLDSQMPPHGKSLITQGKSLGELFSTDKKSMVCLSGKAASGSMASAIPLNTLLSLFPDTFAPKKRYSQTQTFGTSDGGGCVLPSDVAPADAWIAKSLKQMLFVANFPPFNSTPPTRTLYEEDHQNFLIRWKGLCKPGLLEVDQSKVDFLLARRLLYVNGLNCHTVYQLMKTSGRNASRAFKWDKTVERSNHLMQRILLPAMDSLQGHYKKKAS